MDILINILTQLPVNINGFQFYTVITFMYVLVDRHFLLKDTRIWLDFRLGLRQKLNLRVCEHLLFRIGDLSDHLHSGVIRLEIL